MNKESVKQLLYTRNHMVTVASHKNRIYVTIRGFVKDTPDPEVFMERLHELKQYVSPGFTVLLDASQAAVQSQETVEFARYFQELIVEGGVLKMAEVLPDSPLVRMQHKRISELAGTIERREVFISREEAEAWLDARTL